MGEATEGMVVSLPLSLRIWFEVKAPSSAVASAHLAFLRTGCDQVKFPHRWDDQKLEACGLMSSMAVRKEELLHTLRRLKQQLRKVVSEFPDAFPGEPPSDEEAEWLHFCCTSRARTLDGQVQVIVPIG